MPATLVDRPVWRSYRERYLPDAAAHVRAGGFAAVTYGEDRVKLLLPRGEDGKLAEPSLWVLLAIELRRWGWARTGPARGLAAAWLKTATDRDIVRAWCERDSKHPAPLRRMRLDCLSCGVCCTYNRVVLEKEDYQRWRKAGRIDLGGRAYTRTSNGKVVLRLTRAQACVHLDEHSKKCAIYELRPLNCRAFPVASEPCLSAREESLGVVD